MIEVSINSVRVSLMSQHRIVVLQEQEGERYLPIWIGPFEADAITIQLQGIEVARPMTHDLLGRVIESLGGEVMRVLINDLENDTFYAQILLDVDGETVEIDSRPSDAIALAVRAEVPIYVAQKVMDQAGMMPEEEVGVTETAGARAEDAPGEDEDLEVFQDFLDGLDLDSLLGD
jgi:hypothetical protein